MVRCRSGDGAPVQRDETTSGVAQSAHRWGGLKRSLQCRNIQSDTGVFTDTRGTTAVDPRSMCLLKPVVGVDRPGRPC